MDWWNNLIAWYDLNRTKEILLEASIIALAIILGLFLGALTVKSTIKRLMNRADRETRAAVITTLIDLSTELFRTQNLNAPESSAVFRQWNHVLIQLRLLPCVGSDIASRWTEQRVLTGKQDTFGFGEDIGLDISEIQGRLFSWHTKPRRAKKLFGTDLATWNAAPAQSKSVVEAFPRVSEQNGDDSPETSPISDHSTTQLMSHEHSPSATSDPR